MELKLIKHDEALKDLSGQLKKSKAPERLSRTLEGLNVGLAATRPEDTVRLKGFGLQLLSPLRCQHVGSVSRFRVEDNGAVVLRRHGLDTAIFFRPHPGNDLHRLRHP